MGKNKKGQPSNSNLGRALIKGRRQNNRASRSNDAASWRHTSELQDGYDWGRLNLQSVTEQSNLDDFLTTAEMAGVEFTAEKMNVKVVSPDSLTGVLKEDEKRRIKALQEENKKLVTIPRRPPWDSNTSAEQLESNEKEEFLNWRRSLALLQEEKDLLLTPYEKNLNVWRQLWRVIERSDVICQIVDARNPLLFKSDDLESYVKEVSCDKRFMVLVNKSDFLTEKQRIYWANYFTEHKTKVIFWSALEQTDIDESEADDQLSVLSDELHVENLQIYSDEESEDNESENNESENENEEEQCSPNDIQNQNEVDGRTELNESELNDNILSQTSDKDNTPQSAPENELLFDLTQNSHELIHRTSLISYFKKCIKTEANQELKHVTIGLVGYPNVGKSSTINALLQTKKVGVSATPGKTKHFQTLFIDDELLLCDCPGLVFPTFISSKADMVLNGILPIDQLTDHVAPSTVLGQLIPRSIIENTYGINIKRPGEGEDPERAPTSEEILSSYASMRGYMTHNGQPDCPRASRYVLKDFIKGKLLYCHSPPGIADVVYEPTRMSELALEKLSRREEKERKHPNKEKIQISNVDKEFFAEKKSAAHIKPVRGVNGIQGLETNLLYKPWKKHGNKNKREKLRRIYDAK